MRERFNGFCQVVSQRKIVISMPLLATAIAEAPHAWGAAGGALERCVYSHSIISWHRNLLMQGKFQTGTAHNTVSYTVKRFCLVPIVGDRRRWPVNAPGSVHGITDSVCKVVCRVATNIGSACASVLELAISQPLGESVVLHPIVPVIHSQHQVGVLQPA